jgi:hypothetical protein
MNCTKMRLRHKANLPVSAVRELHVPNRGKPDLQA